MSLIERIFGGRRKEKTPVAAGVSINEEEEITVSRLSAGLTNGKGGAIPVYAVSRKTPFPKHLRWKIGTQSVEWMLITPEMAEAMLEYNTDNRPCSDATVGKYARLIRDGGWGVAGNGTCEPIIFSDLPRLLSGQHRLRAIVASGVAQRMLVVFGEPDGNFAYIDQGRRRTAGDIFAINGVPNYAMAASATRLLMAYQSGSTSGDHATGTIDASNQETYEAYLGYPDLQESVKIGLKFARDRLPRPAAASAMHYLCAQKSRRAADEYFNKIASGVGFSRKTEPAKKVRDFLTRSDIGRITTKVAAAVLIRGWNATRTHKSVGSLDKVTDLETIL